MKRVVFAVLVVTLVVSLIISGCAAPAPAPTTPTTTPTPATKPIKIGQLFSQTGANAVTNLQMLNALKFAWDETGYEIGGRKLEIITEDDATTPEVAIDKAKKLIENDKVDILLGPLATSCAVAVAPYTSKMGVPQICVSSSELTMSQYEWFVSFTGSMPQMVWPAADNAYKQGLRAVDIMTEDTVSGHSYLDTFIKEWKKLGGTIVQEQYPPIQCTDYAPYLANLKNADACLAWFAGADAIKFLSQYYDFGIQKKMPVVPAFFGGFFEPFILTNLPPETGNAYIGTNFVCQYSYLIDNPASKKLDEAWVKRAGKHAETLQAEPYSAAQTILEALKATNYDTSPEKFLKAYLALDVQTPVGRIRFDPKIRMAYRDFYVFRIDKIGGAFAQVPTDKKYEQVSPTVGQ